MQDSQVSEQGPKVSRWGGRPILAGLLGVLLVGGLAFVYAIREWRTARELQAQNAEVTAALGLIRSQLDAANARLSAASPSAPVAAEAAPSRSRENQSATLEPRQTRKRGGRRAPDDPRWKKVDAELAEHQQQIASTQQQLDQARTELEANLNSAREDLGSSIARNHNELVALERKGERNYYEFDLTKSKSFQHAGPISLSLHKTNPKKNTYDVIVLVEDSQLARKNVSLYEPVLFYPGDTKQPIELVVNRVEKSRVHGYVSEPKYRASEVAAAASGATPASSPSKPDPEVDLPHRPEPPQ